ncbi:preprotein translocase subunit SecE [Wolbachia endosymbiont of Howardula sp.]|uniref:preprotein translocase subunit SecE n=1 Tax=Wolbachia endosymbiont of Howardula sp. TaxID=2916816 RepID=UPI00217D7D6D|nr:preprotein translocase subunit SecE [Wolbachia endosymbiont of Howardula sp.]UWI83416.1 preprotein translocase subunit SecE [Wolbachia endosymbiont of Howardula sp.]
MKKIVWIKKQEVFSSLLMVIMIILCFSTFFYFIDFLSLYIIKALFGIVYGK